MSKLIEKVYSEIEAELVRVGRKFPRCIGSVSFDTYLERKEISNLYKGQLEVEGFNCYFKAGVLKDENVYCTYTPSKKEDIHTPEVNSGEGN
jgi:hypothetical protein